MVLMASVGRMVFSGMMTQMSKSLSAVGVP